MRNRLVTSRLLLLSVLIAIGIGVLVTKQLLDSRAAIWHRARAANTNLVVTVSHVLKNTLREMDVALQRTVANLGNPEILRLPPHLRDEALFNAMLPRGTGIELVLDHTGKVIYSSRPLASDAMAFPEREYFKVHQLNPSQGLYISHPFRSLLDQQYSVALSRRWSTPDGSFGGVAVITLKLPALRELFAPLELGPNSGINLIMTDGTVVIRFPYGDADTGQSLAGTANFERFISEGSGSFAGLAALDQIERLYAFRSLDGYPLIVNAAQSVDSILGSWRRSALWLGAATLLLMLGSIGLALLAAHGLRAQQRTARLLRRTQHELRTVLDSLPALVAYWDGNLRNRFSNAAHHEWFGLTSEQTHGCHIEEMIGTERYLQIKPRLERVLAGEAQSFEHTMIDAGGTERHIISTYIPDTGTGSTGGFFVLVTDITDRKSAEEALSAEKERFRVTLEAISDAVITTDQNGNVTYQNPAAGLMTGWPLDQARMRPIEDVVALEELEAEARPDNPVRVVLEQRRTLAPGASRVLISRNGDRHDIEDSAAPIFDAHGELVGVVMVFHDVSKARALAHRMRHQAHHDPLTKLPNRRLLEQLANQALAQAARHHRHAGLLYLDLDGFKRINDSLGHDAGDHFLVALSERLSKTLRQGDTLCRQGGDEFIVLMPELQGRQEARALAQRLIEHCSEPMTLDGHNVQVSASVGISLYPDDGDEFDELMRCADKAMYLAKQAGRNRYRCTESVAVID